MRLEAESRLHSEEADRKRQHELHLKQLESQRRKGISPIALAAVALLASGGLAYGYFGVYKPEQERAQADIAAKERLAEAQAIEKQRMADALAAKEREAKQLAEEKAQAEEAAREKAAEAAALAASKAAAADEESRKSSSGSSRSSRSRRSAKAEKSDKGGKVASKRGSDDNDPLSGLDDI